MLQYSHDAGRTWALVREGCFPGSPGTAGCEGNGRELREPTIYNIGEFERWTRVTVLIPRHVAARYLRIDFTEKHYWETFCLPLEEVMWNMCMPAF